MRDAAAADADEIIASMTRDLAHHGGTETMFLLLQLLAAFVTVALPTKALREAFLEDVPGMVRLVAPAPPEGSTEPLQ